jgi:hypothetical protein
MDYDYTDEKGPKMSHTERNIHTPPPPRTGPFASLRGLRDVWPSGAPSSRPEWLRGLTVAALGASLVLLAPGTASAAFTRPFLRQIIGTCPSPGTCAATEVIPFAGPGGVATDVEDNLWVGDSRTGKPPFQLNEFKTPSDEFKETLDIAGSEPPNPEGLTAPGSLTINHATGAFYVTNGHTVNSYAPYVEVFDSKGEYVRRWLVGEDAHIVVDNSTEPSAGSVYVATSGALPLAAWQGPAISKFNPSGERKDFEAAGSVEYVSANQITGTPTKHFGGISSSPDSIAVDSHGDIYTTVQEYQHQNEAAVLEYRLSGLFVQACTGGETPGLGGNHEQGGFGGNLGAVAVDPVSGDILVAVNSNGVRGGAVDEFDSSCHFLNQITETSSGHRLGTVREMTVDSNGDLYVVAAQEHVVDAWGPGAALAGLRLGEATQRRPTSAVLNGSVNPQGLSLSDCHFEYLAEAAFANEVQTLTLSGATGGTFTLSFESQTTFPIPYNATAAQVQTALGNLSAIGSGNVAVSGSAAGGPYTVEFKGSLAQTNVPQLTADSSALTPSGATLTPATTTPGSGWGNATTASCVPAAGSIPVAGWTSVHAEITGLSSGTTYRYRLLATTATSLGGSAASAPLAFTDPHAPAVDSATAENVSSAFADLHAEINPLGADTSYQFQYLTAAAYAENGNSFTGPDAPVLAPATPADIGSGGPTGSSDEAVLQQIGGLAPSTAYRFRVLASNECEAGRQCLTEGPDDTFATLPQAFPGLPDNRAYELVTPPDKGSAEDMFANAVGSNGEFENTTVGSPSESGDGFFLQETNAAFGSFPASTNNAYVFSRALGGWAFTSLASPSLGVQSIVETLFDPSDFSRVALDDRSGSASSASGSRPLSLLGPPGGPYTTLRVDSAVLEINEKAETAIVGASHDLSHVVLESTSHALAPGAAAQDNGSHALYESAGGGECSLESSNCALLDLNPNGKLFTCGAVLGQGSLSGTKHDAVSADGSRVIFTAPDPFAENDGPGCWDGAETNAPQLYLRSGGATVEVSKPEAALKSEKGRHPAIYVGAAADGSRVFFLSEAELTADDAGIHDPELYEWRAEGTAGAGGVCAQTDGCLTRASRGESGDAEAGLRTVPAISADGSAVYFTANGVLASNSGAGGAHAAPGANCVSIEGEGSCNLYRYDTVSGATAYVATVSRYDYPDTEVTNQWWPEAHLPNEVALSPNANWYTTPDGDYLIFATSRELTGYSTAAASSQDCRLLPGSQGAQNGHCDELYRYHFEPESESRGSLACVSCNPSGALPVSNALFTRSAPSGPAAGPVRALSDDGSYAFFDTADALVSTDGNKALDVYQWETQGNGGCALAGGCLHLISSGHGSAHSYFLGASPDGANVFLGTHARLVPQDTDTAGDIYDARICTQGDPCIKPPAGETAQCLGGTCQTPPLLPLFQTPATNTLASSGNFTFEVKPPVTHPPVTLTKAQKLAKALAACAKKPKRQRKKCRAQAHGRYGKKAKKSARARHASSHRRAGR